MQDWIKYFFSFDGLNTLLVYFLLVTPIIVASGGVARHLIGLKMMSLTVFLIITYVLAFLFQDNTLLSVGFGLVLLIFIYFFSYLVKKLTVDAGLHYFSRIALIISLVSIFSLILIITFSKLININDYLEYLAVNPFAVLLAVVLSEYFSANQIQKGYKTSRILFWNTLTLSTIVAFVVSLHLVQSFILDYPYLVLAFVLISYLVGRYQGVRLTEVLRFNNITKLNAKELHND